MKILLVSLVISVGILSGCDSGPKTRIIIHDGENAANVAKYCLTTIGSNGKYVDGKVYVERKPKPETSKEDGEKYCSLFRREFRPVVVR